MQSLTLSPSMNTVIEERTWINHVTSNFVSQPLQPDTNVPFEEHMFAGREMKQNARLFCTDIPGSSSFAK